MSTIQDSAVEHRPQRRSAARTVVSVMLGVLAALLFTLVLFVVVLGPGSADVGSADRSAEQVSWAADECPADACILPMPRTWRA